SGRGAVLPIVWGGGVERDDQAGVFVNVPEPYLLHRASPGRVLIRLTGVHAGTSRITGAHVQDESRAEAVRIASAVVPARRTAGGRAGLPDRRQDRDSLFRLAEEGAVGSAEAVIHSHLIAINCGGLGASLRDSVSLVS